MSHYYIAHPTQLQDALTEYCAAMAPDQANVVKHMVQDFLDSPVSREHGIRIEVKDPVVEPAKVVP